MGREKEVLLGFFSFCKEFVIDIFVDFFLNFFGIFVFNGNVYVECSFDDFFGGSFKVWCEYLVDFYFGYFDDLFYCKVVCGSVVGFV